jgi:hypothetical protein
MPLTSWRLRAADYAYGVPNCKKLAEGTLFASKCNSNPNGPPVQCPAEYSFQNADSLAFVPAGKSQLLVVTLVEATVTVHHFVSRSHASDTKRSRCQCLLLSLQRS